MEMEINPGFREWSFREETRSKAYDEYRLRWRQHPVQGVCGVYPLHIDLEITNRCNLRCPFCIREHDKGMEVGDMNYDLACKIIDECTSKVPGIKFNWRGEPTLYKKLPFLVQRAKQAGFIDIGINTNGTMLTPDMFDSLHTLGLDRIIFSIDSHDPKNYEEQRVGASYHTVLRNLKGAVNLKRMHRWDRPYIRVQKVDIPQLRHENDRYVEFFQGLGVDSVAINTYKNKDMALVQWDPLPCAQPFQRLLIAWDGKAYPCCQGHNFPPVGDTTRQSIKAIWGSKDMNKLRRYHSRGWQGRIPQCKHCETTMPLEVMEKEG